MVCRANHPSKTTPKYLGTPAQVLRGAPPCPRDLRENVSDTPNMWGLSTTLLSRASLSGR
ncbi:hypothetical protein QCN36_gp01 [Arthrobacter phage CastorTray]|uniref:Uncharacterized protein n=1 Tax=Arthrobacter phage CastorTray TaxID=2859632 RepID=A0AAE7WDW9_9CAUD|nr:hypothetical protein QCN36_gp01 [Arthrobacter phage CastorTray]QYC54989.1 hypothetical protein SEA_CASTORTRAY_1 [Arthrobacter phage CastorTray]